MDALKIEEIASHRNGCTGESFYVVAFTCPANGPMVATVFTRRGHVAVLHRGLLNRGVIAGSSAEAPRNAWRGDEYEAELRAAIKTWERARRAQLLSGKAA